MRLLGLMVCCAAMYWASLANADSDCNPNSSLTREILKCATASYKRIDEKLNEQYRILVSSPQFVNKKLLLEGERAWIKYRDFNCSSAYGSFSLGEESEIEKVGCLVSLTSSRLVELIYLEIGTVGDGFYSSLSIIGGISSRTREEVLSYIEAYDCSPEEVGYYEKNCELTEVVYAEEKRSCLARMKFQAM